MEVREFEKEEEEGEGWERVKDVHGDQVVLKGKKHEREKKKKKRWDERERGNNTEWEKISKGK